MLTNLASYLLGYLEPEPEPARAEDVECPAQRLGAAASALPHHSSTDEDEWLLVDATEIENDENATIVRISRSASLSSLPCQQMEESWFLTPPPCFTSTAPSDLETNPLENLLIEHPSMSVYHHRRSRTRSESPLHPPHRHSHPPARQPLATVTDHQLLQCFDLKTPTKYQKKQSLQVNRNQLDRSNKVREVNSRSRRQRRSDRQQQHSGANNNRKCC